VTMIDYKRLLTAGLIAGSAFAAPLSVMAEETERTADVTLVPEKDLTQVPENGLGSVSIELTESKDKRSPEGVHFGVIKVADIVNGQYVYTETFKDSKLDLNDLKTADDMEKAANELIEMIPDKDSSEQDIEIDKDGKAVVSDMSVGVYLFHATDIAGYETVMPFLIAIPTWDAAGELFLYDVDVLPKHDQLPKIAVDKVDAATGKKITSNKFAFTSFSDKDCKDKIETIEGDINTGEALFEVDFGTTYIKETGAPHGYQLSDEVVKVEINGDGMFVNDKEVQPGEDLIYHYTYNNSLIGGTNTGARSGANPGLYIGLAGAALAIGVTIAIKRKKSA